MLGYLQESSVPHGCFQLHPCTLLPDLSAFFLAIGTAYAVLSNPEKRKQYDQFGDDKGQAARHSHGPGDFHRGFEADISPEDLFNMFFGGSFPSSECPHTPAGPASPFTCRPSPDPALPPTGNVHVYSNGRMRYTYQQRPDRRDNQGDVSHGVMEGWGFGCWTGPTSRVPGQCSRAASNLLGPCLSIE